VEINGLVSGRNICIKILKEYYSIYMIYKRSEILTILLFV